MRLTLRTLLAYLDDTLDAAKSREIGLKLADSPEGRELADRITRVVRKRSLGTPNTDPTLVTAYLSDTLSPDSVGLFEQQCLESDAHLAEVAAVHQILTLLLCEQARVPPSANRRMYKLVTGRESQPDRKPGNTIPVGGARDVDRVGDDTDDAAYLFGLSGYGQSKSPAQQAIKGVVGVLLTLLAGTAALLAWPKSAPPSEVREVVAAPRSENVTVALTPVEVAPASKDLAIVPNDLAAPPEPEKQPEPTPAPPAEVAPNPKVVDLKPAEPAPAEAPVAPVNPTNPPSDDRSPLGMFTPKPTAVVVSITAQKELTRLTGDKAIVYGTESLMALPGYKATVVLDGGVRLDLWGNLPELLPTPLPIFESRVTPYTPPSGLTADVSIDAGRVYLSATKPGGVSLRLRAGGRVWDVKLAAQGTKLAAEVAHSLTPGNDPVPTRVRGGLYLVSGQATVTPVTPAGAALELATGAAIYFDGRVAEANSVPPNANDGAAAYWNEFVTPGDRKRAEFAIVSLNDFAAKLTDPTRVRETFYGGLPSAGTPTPQSAAAARVSLFALAAVNDVPKLTAALIDSERPLVRSTAAEGLRAAAADDAAALKVFAETLQANGTTAAQAEQAVKLLRGIPPAEQGDSAAAGRVVEQLRSESLAVRELAYGLLRGAVDPTSPDVAALYAYDPGAPDADRAVAVAAWVNWAKALAKTP